MSKNEARDLVIEYVNKNCRSWDFPDTCVNRAEEAHGLLDDGANIDVFVFNRRTQGVSPMKIEDFISTAPRLCSRSESYDRVRSAIYALSASHDPFAEIKKLFGIQAASRADYLGVIAKVINDYQENSSHEDELVLVANGTAFRVRSASIRDDEVVLYNTYGDLVSLPDVATLGKRYSSSAKSKAMWERVVTLFNLQDDLSGKYLFDTAVKICSHPLTVPDQSTAKKEDLMAIDTKISTPASARRTEMTPIKEQGASLLSAIGNGVKLASVNQGGEVILAMAEKMFGDSPLTAYLLSSESGRELVKMAMASAIHTIAASAPEVAGSKTLEDVAKLQLTFSTSALSTKFFTSCREEIAFLVKHGEQFGAAAAMAGVAPLTDAVIAKAREGQE